MTIKKMMSYLMIISVVFLLAACGNDGEESEKKTEEAPKVEEPEKQEEQKQEETKITKLTLEQDGDQDIKIIANASGEGLIYAYYVLKDNEFYEKFGYQKDNKFTYTITEPGHYKVRVFVKDKEGNKVTKDTEVVEFPY